MAPPPEPSTRVAFCALTPVLPATGKAASLFMAPKVTQLATGEDQSQAHIWEWRVRVSTAFETWGRDVPSPESRGWRLLSDRANRKCCRHEEGIKL